MERPQRYCDECSYAKVLSRARLIGVHTPKHPFIDPACIEQNSVYETLTGVCWTAPVRQRALISGKGIGPKLVGDT